MSAKKILISGAGIAGLSLARRLKHLDIPFKIIEKQSEIASTGAGIALPANAVKALRYLGHSSEIQKYSHQVNKIIYAKPSGTILSQASLSEPPLNSDSFVSLHRGQLYKILLDGLENEINFNTTVKNIHPTDNGIIAEFDGPILENEEYSAIIGADGINSGIRQLAFGNINLVDLAVTNWRWTCNYSSTNLQPTYMLGSKDVFMAYPIGENTVYCYAHVYDPENLFSNEIDHNKIIKNKFSNYSGIAERLLDKLPDNNLIIPGRLRSVPNPLFSQGRVALVGDASNACSPMLQQGAACAFEDVIALSELLANFSIEEAFTCFKEFRQERVTWTINASDNPLKSLVNMNSSFKLFARDMFIKFNGPLNVKGWKTLLATDPIAELPKYIENRKSAQQKNRSFSP